MIIRIGLYQISTMPGIFEGGTVVKVTLCAALANSEFVGVVVGNIAVAPDIQVALLSQVLGSDIVRNQFLQSSLSSCFHA